MLIVVASAAPLFSFKPADVTFVSNVGAVLIAHLAQTLIVEADAAKTGERSFPLAGLVADGLFSLRITNKICHYLWLWFQGLSDLFPPVLMNSGPRYTAF